jgi:hypothetical protein
MTERKRPPVIHLYLLLFIAAQIPFQKRYLIYFMHLSPREERKSAGKTKLRL